MEQACTEMHWHSPTSRVKIQVMTANRLHYEIPKWPEFKTIISEALYACPDAPTYCNIDSVVARLSEEFSKSTRGYGKAGVLIETFRKVLDADRRGKSVRLTEPFLIHCEAALVTFVEFQEKFKSSQELSKVVRLVSAGLICAEQNGRNCTGPWFPCPSCAAQSAGS